MVRRFAPEPPDPTQIERILASAVRAPSAGFSQGWDLLLLDAPEDVERFWAATTDPTREPDGWLRGMRTAPVLVVPLACKEAYLARYAEADKGWARTHDDRDRDEAARWPVPYWLTDTAMATMLMLLTVTDEGLGACFFGIPAERVDAFHEEFGVPADHQPIGVVAIGRRLLGPDGRPQDGSRGSAGRPRRADVVHRGRW